MIIVCSFRLKQTMTSEYSFRQITKLMSTFSPETREKLDHYFDDVLYDLMKTDVGPKELYSYLCHLIFRAYRLIQRGNLDSDANDHQEYIEISDNFNGMFISRYNNKEALKKLYDVSNELNLPNILYLTLFYFPEGFTTVFSAFKHNDLLASVYITLYPDRRFDGEIIPESFGLELPFLSEETGLIIQDSIKRHQALFSLDIFDKLINRVIECKNDEEKIALFKYIRDLINYGVPVTVDEASLISDLNSSRYNCISRPTVELAWKETLKVISFTSLAPFH